VSGNRIVERFPDQYLVVCPISVETMPMLHYYPGAKFLQISTTGCNFNCEGCISTVIVREMSPESNVLKHLSPQEVVNEAVLKGCAGIAFLMNDPLASLPSFLKVARLARSEGLKVGCSSNGYFTASSLGELLPYLDFINLGVKGFSDKAYQACGAPGVQPVFRNLETLHRAGVHVEVSCIFTRSNRAEVEELAKFLATISARIPLQVMRFLPFEQADIDGEPSIRESEELCGELRETLDFVYLFNSPGTKYLHTPCPECDQIASRRDFYGPMGAKLLDTNDRPHQTGRCLLCGHDLHMVGARALLGYQEGDFEGGYPLTRALEMVQAMLIAMGVDSRGTVVRAWEEVLRGDGLKRLHRIVQDPGSYIEALRYFGELAGVSDRAEELASYLSARLDKIKSSLASITHLPRVYYAMGKPLFYLNAGRLENRLVELAGGVSLNCELPDGGRPGRSLTVSEFNRLNPEVIFISSFISNSVKDFLAECADLGVDVEAVRCGHIIVHPCPGWDFGSPRWILGLMVIASRLHPDHCPFDVTAEARAFYQRFYGMQFDLSDVNRSFSKPARRWRWREQALMS
jgi:pyruvate-formate lyase-activating enzyme